MQLHPHHFLQPAPAQINLFICQLLLLIRQLAKLVLLNKFAHQHLIAVQCRLGISRRRMGRALLPDIAAELGTLNQAWNVIKVHSQLIAIYAPEQLPHIQAFFRHQPLHSGLRQDADVIVQGEPQHHLAPIKNLLDFPQAVLKMWLILYHQRAYAVHLL